jgi:hypothetical protein
VLRRADRCRSERMSLDVENLVQRNVTGRRW